MNIHQTLDLLGIKERAQKVFVHLITHGISSVTTIAKATHLPKSSVYDGLAELSEKGLIIEYSENRAREFGVVSIEQLEEIGAAKMEQIKNANSFLRDFIKDAEPEKNSSRPKITFYVGADGIRQAFRDNMWHSKCKNSYLMWPTKEMVTVLGEEFSKWHSAQRLKHGVVIHVVRKDSDRAMNKDVSKKGLLESAGWRADRNVRHAPKSIDWDMSYWIYDDKCLFASSGAEKFAFIVHSKEFANLMHVLWKQVWNISKE